MIKLCSYTTDDTNNAWTGASFVVNAFRASDDTYLLFDVHATNRLNTSMLMNCYFYKSFFLFLAGSDD